MEIAHRFARRATTPIRLGLSAGGVGLSVARAVVEEARRKLGRDGDRAERSPSPASPTVRPASPDSRGHGDPLAPIDQPPSPSPSPKQPVVAGAEVHVDPPWDDYDRMTAAEIRDRLAGATLELAAAVSLYESLGRARSSVVGAADRRVRALGA